MYFLDDWHDFVRVLSFTISLYCVLMLLVRWKQNHNDWNEKTLDYWYAFLMWCISGCVLAAQGITLDRPATPGFVFVTAAVLVTGRGLNRKGSWGGVT